MARLGTLAALKAADRTAGQAHYAWQVAVARHGSEDHPVARDARDAYERAAQARAAAATAMHARQERST